MVSTRCLGGPVEILARELSVGLADLSSASLAKTMKIIYSCPPAILPTHVQPYEIGMICQQYIALSQPAI